MDIEKEKVYRAWPSGPPTYQQANSEHLQGITHNRQWNYSLFSCFEPGSLCLMGYCFPCITFGKTQARNRDPGLSYYSLCNTECSLFGFLALFGSHWIIQTIKRGETRDRFGIEGSCCGDCCVSICCSCCAVIQEEKEVELRTRPEHTGYQMNPGMAYP